MNIALLLFVIASGAGLTVQAAVNSRLREAIGQPIMAALISFAIGAVGLAAVLLTGWMGKTKVAGFGEAPWWAWIGGIFGAVYVATSVVAVPKIGTAALICLVVAGQLISSLVVDSLGLLGAPRVPINFSRVAGAVLLIGAVILMQKR